ncbi:hypothetical protein ACJQWK_09785 [Exserohilum turcicum]
MEFITTTTATSTSHQAAPPVAAPWRNESKLSWETKQPLLLRIRPTCAIFFCSIHGETRLFREHSRKTACVGPLTTHTHTHTPRAAQHARPSMSGSLYRLIHSPLLHGQLSISMRTGKEQKKASPLFASELATRCPHGCTWAHTHGIAPSPQLRNIRRHSNVVTVLSSFRPSKET